MSQDLAVDIAKQEISSGYLEFFELEIGTDTTGNGNNVLFFHDGKNENIEDIKVSKTTAAPTIIKYNAICFLFMVKKIYL